MHTTVNSHLTNISIRQTSHSKMDIRCWHCPDQTPRGGSKGGQHVPWFNDICSHLFMNSFIHFIYSFNLQHEAYNIERNAKKVKESAVLFYDM